MRTLLSIAILSFATILATGCKTNPATNTCSCSPCTCSKPCPCGPKKASLSMMNDTCGMSGRPVTASSPQSNYNGEAIGFCCNGCKAKFDSMDTQAKVNYVSEMQTNGA